MHMDEKSDSTVITSRCSEVERCGSRGSAIPLDTLSDANRRRVLVGLGSLGTLALAGCITDDDDDVARYLVGFHHESERTEVEVREDEVLLYPALDADVDIPYRCEVGRCGDCTVKFDGDATDVAVHDGNEYLSDEQISDGWILTCVAYPRDDFDAEVAHPDDD